MFISGVILAAGSSSRLGRPKQLLELDDEPILRIVVRNAIASRLGEVIVVLGAHAKEIAGAVGDLGQRIVEIPIFAKDRARRCGSGFRPSPRVPMRCIPARRPARS